MHTSEPPKFNLRVCHPFFLPQPQTQATPKPQAPQTNNKSHPVKAKAWDRLANRLLGINAAQFIDGGHNLRSYAQAVSCALESAHCSVVLQAPKPGYTDMNLSNLILDDPSLLAKKISKADAPVEPVTFSHEFHESYQI